MVSYTFWHKLHFSNKIVCFTKQLKQNVQFLHAVALLSIYITKIVKRIPTFFTEHRNLLKTKLSREPEVGVKQNPRRCGRLLVKYKHAF